MERAHASDIRAKINKKEKSSGNRDIEIEAKRDYFIAEFRSLNHSNLKAFTDNIIEQNLQIYSDLDDLAKDEAGI